MQTSDLRWLSGYLEGEGCFCVTAGKQKWHYPKITVTSVDQDIIERVSKLFGRALIGPTQKRLGQPIYETSISGRGAVGYMLTLYPLMGKRRQTKIKEILLRWKQAEKNWL